jgi:hypothetical protein
MEVSRTKGQKILRALGLLCGLSSFVVDGSSLKAQGTGESEDGFQIGGSCAALAYSSTASLRSLIAGGFADDFHSFCYPEEPSECADYTSFLKGVGRLTTGEDGYHCSLHL